MRTNRAFADSPLTTSDPIHKAFYQILIKSKCIYNLHRPNDDDAVSAGIGIYDTNSILAFPVVSLLALPLVTSVTWTMTNFSAFFLISRWYLATASLGIPPKWCTTQPTSFSWTVTFPPKPLPGYCILSLTTLFWHKTKAGLKHKLRKYTFLKIITKQNSEIKM